MQEYRYLKIRKTELQTSKTVFGRISDKGEKPSEILMAKHRNLLKMLSTIYPKSRFCAKLPCSDKYSVTMIHLVLNDLRRPAGVGFYARLHLQGLVLHLDVLITLTLAWAAEE